MLPHCRLHPYIEVILPPFLLYFVINGATMKFAVIQIELDEEIF